MAELLARYVSEFRAGFPNVPFAPGVDAEGIKSDDPDPMFVTLPLVAVGAKLGNSDERWTKPDVENLVKEIQIKRPEGILGHVAAEKRSTEYTLPSARW